MSGTRPVRIACIGDSITYGMGLEHREVECYPSVLQRLLGPGYLVGNFGNSGRTVYLHTYRPPPNESELEGYYYQPERKEALEFQPDIVICNLGINDGEEYTKYERDHPGAFVNDYMKLLSEFVALPTKPRFFIWGKLSPLGPGQKCYDMPGMFLLQRDLEEVARRVNARLIDMQEPMRPFFLETLPDLLHPNADGARIIAEATYKVLMSQEEEKVEIPQDVADRAEVWLLAGQSNMQWPLEKCIGAETEAQAVAGHDIRLWDFETASWHKITPENALKWSCIAVAFARRRAERTKRPIAVLLVAVGGAPAEAFLSEETMAAVDSNLKQVYPHLFKIVRNRKQIDTNEDFPCKWCAQEYRSRINEESKWWGLAAINRAAISKIKHLHFNGILWYQGESNATTGVGERDGEPLPVEYMEETIRASVQELRGGKKTPMLVVGLPVMNREWGPYRSLQKKVCDDTGCVFLDTYAAGLGDMNNVHPTDKVPFAEMAVEAATKVLG